jgi:hypothetical protein
VSTTPRRLRAPLPARRRTDEPRVMRVGKAIDNALLDLRTARFLARFLWRPLVAELWSQRARRS